MKKILVIGSLNMDTVIETPRIPVPGDYGRKCEECSRRKRRESGLHHWKAGWGRKYDWRCRG